MDFPNKLYAIHDCSSDGSLSLNTMELDFIEVIDRELGLYKCPVNNWKYKISLNHIDTGPINYSCFFSTIEKAVLKRNELIKQYINVLYDQIETLEENQKSNFNYDWI